MLQREGVRILVVDDDDVKRYVITRALRTSGYLVEEVSTGQEAITRAQEQPALIVLDVGLPDLDGFEVCRRLKEDPRTATIPVLQISAVFVGATDRVHGLESGADAYLVHAANPPELVATVKALLRMRQAEDTARDLGAQWQVTFDAISDGVVVIDHSGIIRRCNRAFANVLGGRTTELVGRSLAEVAPPDLAREVPPSQHNGRDIMPGTPREVALGGRWYRLTVDVVPAGRSELDSVACTLADITDQRHTEDSLRFLAGVGATLGVLENDRQALESIARLAVPDFADWCLVDLFDEQGHSAPAAAAHKNPDQVPLAREFQRRVPVDRFTAVQGAALQQPVTPCAESAMDIADLLRELAPESSIRVPMILHNQVIGAMRFFSACASRSYSAADLLVAQEVARRATVVLDNARLYRALKEGDRRKDEFLAMLAHELRNPLAPLLSAVELLHLRGDDPEVVNLARDSIGHQVQHLTRLVDDLLDVSRIMQGKITLRSERVPINRVVERAVETSRPLIASHNHRLEIQLPEEAAWVEGDVVRLAQCVSNLLNNAAKYTEPGGEIGLSVRIDDSDVYIRVKDNGIGIPSDALIRIFDLFTQADCSVERSQGGLGIGLTLVRSLLEMHGGSVIAHSEGAGLGSEFTIRLPRCPPELELPDVPSATIDMTPRRILVVDDNRGAAHLLAKLLSKLGEHTIEVAYDGLGALEAAKRLEPDLVLLDIGLPVLNGYDVAARLREMPEHRNTLLVALTGYGQDQDRRRSHAAGFDRHIVKPVSLQVLRELLTPEGIGARGEGRGTREKT